MRRIQTLFRPLPFLILCLVLLTAYSAPAHGQNREIIYKDDIAKKLKPLIQHWALDESKNIQSRKMELHSRSESNKGWQSFFKVVIGLCGIALAFMNEKDSKEKAGTDGSKPTLASRVSISFAAKVLLALLIFALPWVQGFFFPILNLKELERTAARIISNLDEIYDAPMEKKLAIKSANKILSSYEDPLDPKMSEQIFGDIDILLALQSRQNLQNLESIYDQDTASSSKLSEASTFNFNIVPTAWAGDGIRLPRLLEAMIAAPNPLPGGKRSQGKARQTELEIDLPNGVIYVFGDRQSIDKSFFENSEYNHLNIPGFGIADNPQPAEQKAMASAKAVFAQYILGLISDSSQTEAGLGLDSRKRRIADSAATKFMKELTLPDPSLPYYSKVYRKASVYACVVFFKVKKYEFQSKLGQYLKENGGYKISHSILADDAFSARFIRDDGYQDSKLDTLARISDYSSRATQYFQSGKFDSSARMYSKAINLDSMNPIPFGRRGYALVKAGKVEDAIGSLEMALRLNPNDIWDRYNLSVALLRSQRSGKKDESIQQLGRVIKLDPNFKRIIAGDVQFNALRSSPSYKSLFASHPTDDQSP